MALLRPARRPVRHGRAESAGRPGAREAHEAAAPPVSPRQDRGVTPTDARMPPPPPALPAVTVPTCGPSPSALSRGQDHRPRATSFQQLRRRLPTTRPASGGPDSVTRSPASRLSPASLQTPSGPYPHCPLRLTLPPPRRGPHPLPELPAFSPRVLPSRVGFRWLVFPSRMQPPGRLYCCPLGTQTTAVLKPAEPRALSRQAWRPTCKERRVGGAGGGRPVPPRCSHPHTQTTTQLFLKRKVTAESRCLDQHSAKRTQGGTEHRF